MKMFHRLVLLFCLTVTSHVYAYDPVHDGNSLIDADGDRNPGTQFDIDALGLSSNVADISFVESGDRGAGNPKNTFEQTGGGRIIDVSDLGACSSTASCATGKTPEELADINTEAFQKAITFVLTTLYQSGCGGGCNTYNLGNPGGTKNYIIYVPSGTYLVSDTLSYKTNWNGNPLWINGIDYSESFLYVDLATVVDDVATVQQASSLPAGSYAEAFARMRIIGQSRSLAIIKAYGNSWSNKPILSFGNPLSTFNSSVSYNTLRHLTINANSTGATGVQFSGANNSGMHNLRIQGGNQNGYGVYIKSAASQGYHNDLLIEDFDTAIYTAPYHATHNSFEHVTISRSATAIKTQDSGLSLRKIKATTTATTANCTPAVDVSGAGQVVIVDSTLKSSSLTCYIDLDRALSVTTNGHIHSRGMRLETSTDIDEDCSNRTAAATVLDNALACATSGDPSTLAIMPANPSRYSYYNNSYVEVNIKSDAELRACLGIGVTSTCPGPYNYTLFFPNETYAFGTDPAYPLPYQVPTNIKIMSFLYGSFTTTGGKYLFKASGSSVHGPLIIEDITSSGPLFAHYIGSRPLVLRHLGGANGIYQNISANRQTVYFESVVGLGKSIPLKNLDGWARSINTEMNSTGASGDPGKANFPLADGASLWVLGYKTEKNQPSFGISHPDSQLEVLGGFANQRGGAFVEEIPDNNSDDDPDRIPYSVVAMRDFDMNARVSYIGFTSGTGSGITPCQPNSELHFDKITRQKVGGSWVETTWGNDYPKRTATKYCNDIFIPLYVAVPDTKVRFVDIDSPCMNCDGLTWSGAYKSITEAVDELNDPVIGGGTIYIGEGSYEEIAITISEPIKIIGAGMGVTSWEYNQNVGAALTIESGAAGTQISKLTIRPQQTANYEKMTSLDNGGVHINNVEPLLDKPSVSLDQVLFLYFGGRGVVDPKVPDYMNPALGTSYCLKVTGDNTGDVAVTNSEFTFCNNAIVLLDMKDGSTFEFNRSVTHFTRAGPALYVDAAVNPATEIKVTSSWFAMKNSATAGEEYSKYMVYLNGGHSIFSNTETELNVTNTHDMKSHHIYVGTNNNSFTNHIFVAGENPDSPITCDLAPGADAPLPPYALNITGNHNKVFQHIGTSEGCGEPVVHNVGINNTIWAGYPPVTP